MSPNVILLLQSILIFLQMVNAAMGSSLHLSPVYSVLISAFVGAFQYYVNHLGNIAPPPPPKDGALPPKP